MQLHADQEKVKDDVGVGLRTLVRGETCHDESVRPRLEGHHDPRLEPAGIVDVGELGAGGLEVVATVKPEPSVVRRSLAGRDRVLPWGRDNEAMEVLARVGANGVGCTGGVAAESAPAGQVVR